MRFRPVMAAQLTLTQPSVSTRRGALVVYGEPKGKAFGRRVRIVCKVAAILISVVVIVLAVLTYNAYSSFAQLIDQQIAGGYLRSHEGLYAAPRIIEKGARVSRDQLANSLQKAGYARDKASNVWNGSFQVSETKIRILPRQGSEAHEWVDVNFDNNDHVTSLSANDYSGLSSYALEPELLTEDATVKIGQQETLTYQDIPPVLVQAILAIEDKRFFEHNGVDIRGMGRAFLSWATSGSLKFRQGGSTITQQLVKNTYLTSEKTLKRKFNEAMIALALEQRLSKQDIFALYCNEIYLGQRNGVGVRGVAQAARIFFGKELKDISLVEAATIAGLIQSPARYAPDRHPDAAKKRRDMVIAAMSRDGVVDSEEAQRESTQPVNVAVFEGRSSELAPYYIDTVNRALDNAQSAVEPDADHSLRVLTTIDPDLQTAAENALRRQLDLLGKSAKGKALPQGAMVAIDVRTGQVLAMVGGSSYEESQLNRATDAKRQPGSVFKPFVYATAFEAGISPLATYRDAPQTFEYDHANYSPANYGKQYSMGDVMLREGLVRSLNVVTVDLAMRIGLSRIAATAERFGLPTPDVYPSMALGTSETTPLQMAAAYSAFANGGVMFEPTVIAGVVDKSTGELVGDRAKTSRQVIKPTTAYMITDLLSDVIKRGTARRAKDSFKNVAIAGKTGTSHDGWFVGYTPNLVCAVWVGFDDNKQLGLTGAESALPAWMDFMKEALAIRPSLGGTSFPKPSGIYTVKVDPETGYLAGPNCPTSLTVSVARQFVPMGDCYKHLPEVEPIEDSYEADVDLKSESQNSDPDPDSAASRESERSAPTEEMNQQDAGSQVDLQPTRKTRPTQKATDQDGRASLVSAPAVANDGRAPRIGNGRP